MRLKAPGARTLEFTRTILRSVLEALDFLHTECGIIHTGNVAIHYPCAFPWRPGWID